MRERERGWPHYTPRIEDPWDLQGFPSDMCSQREFEQHDNQSDKGTGLYPTNTIKSPN